jgi:uncharacterized protein (DUF486 family)
MNTKLAPKPLLVTSSILDSYAWYKEAPGSWKEKAETDLTNALFRIYTPMDAAVQRGVDFEGKICRDLYLERYTFVTKHGDMMAPFYDMCHGGLQQAPVKRTVVVDGQDFLLYGKADILFPKEHIIDIKTTGAWKGMAKYTTRAQHLLYTAATGIEKFTYLVAVGENKKTGWTVDSVIPVDASTSIARAMEMLEERIRMWIAFLHTRPTFLKAYIEVFTK